MSGPRWMARFTVQNPRYALSLAEWTIAVVFGVSAYRSNNPVSLVLCLIPIPFLAIAALAELLRYEEETK